MGYNISLVNTFENGERFSKYICLHDGSETVCSQQVKKKVMSIKLPEQAVILSPMAGYSDMPYRKICRKMGSAASITEFVSAEAIRRDISRSFQILEFEESERPVIFQIFGEKPESILEAAQRVCELNPDGIDINMGCSVKKIASKGSGAALLKEPKKVGKIISLLTKHLSVPVSAKIRLGWSDNERNYLEVCKVLEGEGAWAVFVHGRTKAQAYTGRADWEAIGEAARSVNIPVFGNGDLTSIEEAREKMERYNLAGALIGRAAMGNPWIFSGRQRGEFTYSERLPVILEHLELMVEFYGPLHGTILFRKHLGKYLKGLAQVNALKNELLRESDPEKIEERLKRV